MKSLNQLVLLAMMLSLTSCATTQSNSFCSIANPIYISKNDKLTPNTAQQIYNHDVTGTVLCGWVKTK